MKNYLDFKIDLEIFIKNEIREFNEVWEDKKSDVDYEYYRYKLSETINNWDCIVKICEGYEKLLSDMNRLQYDCIIISEIMTNYINFVVRNGESIMNEEYGYIPIAEYGDLEKLLNI